jgi:hypothetical protein
MKQTQELSPKPNEVLDKVLGSSNQPYTLNWCLHQIEINLKSGWSNIPGVSNDIIPNHILGNGLYKLRNKINELKNNYHSESLSMSQAVADLDEVLGSSNQPYTLNWYIHYIEFHVTSDWSNIPILCDNIIPNHILGNGLYKLRNKINELKQEYLPTAFRFSGVIMDIKFDTALFNNLVQQNLRPDCVVTRTVSNPSGSNVTTSDSFTYNASMQESVSLTFDTLQTYAVEIFNELQVSTHNTTQVGGEAGFSLLSLINIGGSANHSSSQTTNSTNQTRTRETSLTRKWKNCFNF